MAIEDNQIRIVWSPEDIQSLCPEMSDDEAIEAINTIRDSFKDRATEEGWNILETLLEMYGYLKDEEEKDNCLCGLCSCGAKAKYGHLCAYCDYAHPDYHKHDCEECEE